MENGQVPTYEEAFPPLASPTSLNPPAAASAMFQGGTQSAWPVKSIPSSSVTQVGVERERERIDEGRAWGRERERKREGEREKERERERVRESRKRRERERESRKRGKRERVRE